MDVTRPPTVIPFGKLPDPEFCVLIDQLYEWRDQGLLAFTINGSETAFVVRFLCDDTMTQFAMRWL